MERFRTVVAWIKCRKYMARPLGFGLAVAVLGVAGAWWALAARAGQKPSDSPSYPLTRLQPGGIDRTQAPSKEAAAPGQEPVLKVYRCPPGTAEEVADALRGEFGPATGARIVPEQRTSQVLVVASPLVQARIAGRLGDAESVAVIPRPRDGRAPAGLGAADRASPGPISPSEIQLSTHTGEQMEATLVEALGNRLEPASGPSGSLGQYRLSLKDGTTVELSIDRRGHRVRVVGSGEGADSLRLLVRTLDTPKQSRDEVTRVIPLTATRPADAQRAIAAIRTGNAPRTQRPGAEPTQEELNALAKRLGQAEKKPTPEKEKVPPEAAKKVTPGTEAEAATETAGGLFGQVQIEVLPGDVLLIRGTARDVEMVKKIIEQIEEIARKTEPEIQVYPLEHVDCMAMATLVTNVYTQVYYPRQGEVLIVALVRPNALLLVGRKENVERARALAEKLDSPVSPEAQVRVFFLKHATANNVWTTVQTMYPQAAGGVGAFPGAAAPGALGAVGGLGPQVRVSVDFRANALIVQASPRDMAEVAALIDRLDIQDIPTVNQIRIYQLKHVMAATLQTILDTAIHGQGGALGVGGGVGGGAPVAGGVPAAFPGGAGGAGGMRGGANQRSTALQFITVDERGKQVQALSSGILSDVQFTANSQNNTLVVSAPEKALPLIEAVIQQMDRPPAVKAMIKIFKIAHGDALVLMQTLNQFFGISTTGAGGLGGLGGLGGGGIGGAGGGGVMPASMISPGAETSLVPLRFMYDQPSNSIMAAGTYEDLVVVESILLSIGSGDSTNRKTKIYELKNRPASAVYTAITGLLTGEQSLVQSGTSAGFFSTYDLVDQVAVVVAEPVSNSLIVSATPKYIEKIDKLIYDLDKRPPMVMIQVLLAEVSLTDNDEFGVELGLQDSLLYNRGIPNASGVLTPGAAGTPGFAFNNQPLANNNINPKLVGTQGLSSLGVGRSGGLGIGGLVLSASSEHVSILIRALKATHRLEVLSCPSIMTLDNQSAQVMVGQYLSYISGVTTTGLSQTNSVTQMQSGLILGVTPRISPDGLVVMDIDANKSAPGPESEGTVIGVENGVALRQPKIDVTLAQTTVAVPDGQTVVLGGLIQKTTSRARNQVPLLGDIPFFGPLFRYEAATQERRELLIIMTPRVVYNDDDADSIKRTEAARMHWCLADVIDVYGIEGGLRGRKDEWSDAETRVIYPDAQPGVPRPRPRPNGAIRPEKAPAPTKAPVRLDVPPPPSEGSNGQAVPQGSAAIPGDGRPGFAPTVGMSGRYSPPGSVMPARYDPPDAGAGQDQNRNRGQAPSLGAFPSQAARFATEPAPFFSAPVQDPRQQPLEGQPFTNPLRGEYP